jgi:parallel beta-helix repeat protein
VAIDDAGNFVVAWQTNHLDPSFFNIFAQRFDASGAKLGGEFRVDAVAGGDVVNPSVAMDALGNFVIAFENRAGYDGDGYGIYARLYDSQGQSVTGGFNVNTYSAGDQTEPAVGMDDDGEFVVVWASDLQDGDLRGIYGKRFDPGGGLIGTEFQVNETTANDQYDPSIAVDGSGHFVVAWTGHDGLSKGIFAQRFNDSGSRIGCEFQVNTSDGGDQEEPSVGIGDDGIFTVVWRDSSQEGDYGIYGQSYDANLKKQGIQFRVNSTTAGDQANPAAGVDANQRTFVAWDGNGPIDPSGVFSDVLVGSAGPYIYAEHSSRASAASQSSLTWSHTVGNGTSRFLAVGISYDGGSPGPATVTYAGNPLTIVASITAQNQAHVQLWGLAAPPVGTADVVVTLGSAEDFSAGAVSFFGVDQTTPYGSWTGNEGIGAPASLSATLSTGELMLSAIAVDNGPVLTTSTCQAAHWNAGPAAVTGACGTLPGTGAPMSMSWNYTGNNRWAMIAAPLYPAGSPAADQIVTNTLDSGPGSLRAALDYANLNPGTTVSFDIPDTDPGYRTDGTDHWWRITPASALPTLTASGTTIDASTQTTNRGDLNTRGPEIEISGTSAGVSDGLAVVAAATVVLRDLAINGFDGHGVQINGAAATGVEIVGCYIGANALGDTPVANTGYGVWVTSGASNVDIGGIGAGEGNLISGNGNYGLYVDSGSLIRIRGNKIGTDATGTAAVSNTGYGLVIGGTASDITVGGSVAGAGNVVAGNGAQIMIEGSASSVTLHGNAIGTDTSGTIDLSTGRGIELDSSANPSNIVIGGFLPGEGNLIAYNATGIMGWWSGGRHRILGNTIRNSSGGGMALYMPNVEVSGNVIHDNSSQGIFLATGATGTKVYHNTIHGNGSSGLEVATDAGASVHNNAITGNTNLGLYLSGGTLNSESHNLVTDDLTNPPNGSRGNITFDATDLNADPLFVDAASADFSLTACTSPAVNAGDDLGGDQPDMNGTEPGSYNGSAPDMGALETSCGLSFSLSGTVFEDADFAGTAAGFDGGSADVALDSVDVELYAAGDSSFLATTQTDASGFYVFSGLSDGDYLVRVRSATIGDANTPPAGGLNATVPATWPYPLPEMTWGNGSALFGGQSAAGDDADTGDDAGPGDTWLAVTVSGSGAADVDFGFAYNLIVTTADDGLADSVRSDQGSLRQFIKNANAIAGVQTTRCTIPTTDPNYSASPLAYTIQPLSPLPVITDTTTVDGTTQPDFTTTPVVVLDGVQAGAGANGLDITAGGSTVRGLVIQRFALSGIHVTLNGGNTFEGNYIGTDATGLLDRGNGSHGIHFDADAGGNTVGGVTAAAPNLISGNGANGIFLQSSSLNTLFGNRIGTDRNGAPNLGNGGHGILIDGGDGNTVGGSAAGQRNIISGNQGSGVLVRG